MQVFSFATTLLAFANLLSNYCKCNAFTFFASFKYRTKSFIPKASTLETVQAPEKATRGAESRDELLMHKLQSRDLQLRTKLFAAQKVTKQSSNSANINNDNNHNATTVIKTTVVKNLPHCSSGLDLPYESALEALKVYKSIHGNLVIPRRYIVPETNTNETISSNNHSSLQYPPEWQGVDLSSSVYNMKWWQKHVKQRPERVAELNKLGFIWQRLQPEWNLVLEALITYSQIYGNTLVPYSFVVPFNDSQWPISTWKIPLGNCVYRIRNRNDFLHTSSHNNYNAASRRKQLDGLGFIWDVSEYHFQTLVQALQFYASINECGPYSINRIKPVVVPTTFVVPANSTNWPQELWDYPLGAKCVAVRQKLLYVKNNPYRQQTLDRLGFYWGGNSDVSWLRVVHAAAIYSRLHQRNLDVPYNFVVPSPNSVDSVQTTATSIDDWPWPEYLWGLPLGQRLKDVRVKGAYLNGKLAVKRKKQLEALGFVWKAKRGRRRLPK